MINVSEREMQILDRLRDTREKLGLTQATVGIALGYSGGSSTISGYERGQTAITLDVFLKLCKFYNISPVWALTGLPADFDGTAVYDALRQQYEILYRDFADTLRILEKTL